MRSSANGTENSRALLRRTDPGLGEERGGG
jgi:hypothetical protein